jgi:hypothetical protein
MAHQGDAPDGTRMFIAAVRNVNDAGQKVKPHLFGKYLIHIFE